MQIKSSHTVPIDPDLLARIIKIVGPIASYASEHSIHSVGEIRYCVYDKHVGNSYIGYIGGSIEEGYRYQVGNIARILEVKQGRDKASKTIFLVRRNKTAPDTIATFLQNQVFSHKVLGLLIVSEEKEEDEDIVPVEQVVGHVAVCSSVRDSKVVVLLTIQLSRVRQIYLLRFTLP
jgi:hypothetical protein